MTRIYLRPDNRKKIPYPYFLFPIACYWCDARFTKGYRICPKCGMANSHHALRDMNTSRYHRHEF